MTWLFNDYLNRKRLTKVALQVPFTVNAQKGAMLLWVYFWMKTWQLKLVFRNILNYPINSEVIPLLVLQLGYMIKNVSRLSESHFPLIYGCLMGTKEYLRLVNNKTDVIIIFSGLNVY